MYRFIHSAIITLILTLWVGVINSANRVYIDDIDIAVISRGQKKVVPLMIESDVDITSLQCDLYLPEGISVSSIGVGSFASESHKVDWWEGDSYTRIVCYSSLKQTFNGRSGDVVLIELDIAGTVTIGSYICELKNAYLSDIGKPAQGYDTDDTSFTISVKQQVLVESITLSGYGTIEVGETLALQATISPDNAYNKELTWNSSNENIAVVDENGVVTGVSMGSVTITATAKDGTGISATCIVKVEDYISFADPNVESICLQYWDKNKDGRISKSETSSVTTLERYFNKTTAIATSIRSFDELQYFTGLKTLNKYAFSGCTNLESITFPSTMTTIEMEALYNCSSLNHITLSSSLINIGEYALYHCSSLERLIIPSTLINISETAFRGCSGLKSIEVESGNTKYDSRNNCNALILTSTNTLTLGCENTVIPNSILSIADYAFYNCEGLSVIDIPGSVTTIGNYAFCKCINVNSIFIPIAAVSIASNAFRSCSSVSSITIEDGNPVYDSRSDCNALIETSSNTLLFGCKNTIIPSTVTTLGTYAFSGCTGLTTIEIPSSVTAINAQAFSNSGLTAITLPTSLTSLAGAVFAGCPNIKSIEIPSQVTIINSYTFNGCTALETVVLGDGVTSIEDNAFNGCVNLKEINIPANVTTINKTAFTGCTGYSVFINSKSLVEKNYSSSENCLSDFFGTGVIKYTIGDNITKIGSRAFNQKSSTNTELQSVEIHNTVLSIGEYSFSSCGKLSKINIPNSVTSIDDYAFYNCSGLLEISLGSGLKKIDNYAFQKCTSLKTVRIAQPVETKASNIFDGLILANMTLYVPYGTLNSYKKNNFWGKFGTIIAGDNELDFGTFGNSGNWTYDKLNHILTIGGNGYIPSNTYNGLPWLYYQNDVVELKIEDDMNSINNICQGWENLERVSLSNSLERISAFAFDGCSKLTDIDIPNSVVTIEEKAFQNCESLINIIIPSNVESIGSSSFISCTSLQSVIFGNNLETIGDWAFTGCRNLSNVVFGGNKLRSIGTAAFQECSSLNKIELPSSVKALSSQAFYNCPFEEISLPESIGTIEGLVFGNCRNLKDVYCYATTLPSLNTNSFTDYEKPTLHVPESAISLYQRDTNWKQFKNIVVLKPKATNVSELMNAIYMDSVVISTGTSTSIAIKMKNNQAVSAYQFDFILPTGVSIAVNDRGKYIVTLSNRHDGHTMSSSLVADNTYRFAVLSFSGDEVSGNDGDILNVTLQVDDDMEGNEYPIFIKEAAYSTPSGSSVTLPNSISIITVEDVILGDVNKDGKIDIADAVGIVNYILNKPSTTFVEKAANVNKDNRIDIADAVAIINQILNK